MRVTAQEFDIPTPADGDFLRSLTQLAPGKTPVRCVVPKSDALGWHCEVDVLDDAPADLPSIFDFVRRGPESAEAFTAVLLVPTGIGAEIGGHSGDAGPVARLLAGACDTLVTHPNVVNAADINELPENGLYVEGSVICRLLMGTVGLQRVRSNRVLVVMGAHEDQRIADLVVNSVSAARAALGLDCPEVVRLDPPFTMRSTYSASGRAVGQVDGLDRLCAVLESRQGTFDAVALASIIDVPESYHTDYFTSGGDMVNPWGGVEAMLTHAVSVLFDVPSAHAPMVESHDILDIELGVVDPRMSAEAVSSTYLHSVLKGLHRSPRLVPAPNRRSAALTADDVSCLVVPDGCVGLPTLAALEQGIPVIAVRENRNRMQNDLRALPFAPGKLFIVENYLEAVGVMTALKAGVAVSSVRRPLSMTAVSDN